MLISDFTNFHRYRTLTDRLLHINLFASRQSQRRDISYEFMNRQMVWHAFTVSLYKVSTPVCLACILNINSGVFVIYTSFHQPKGDPSPDTSNDVCCIEVNSWFSLAVARHLETATHLGRSKKGRPEGRQIFDSPRRSLCHLCRKRGSQISRV